MAYDNNFLGKNGFVWFNGVVEDRNDPQKLGRLRVRCVGIHTDNKDDLPTADLPWSQLIHPITSSGISGLGSSPGFIVEGSWVFGYFRDGMAMQEPMVIGTLPGKPSELANVNKGFYDPNGVYPKYKDEVDTNRLATNDSNNPHLGLELRKLTRKTAVPTADFDAVAVEDHVATSIPASDHDTWSQPSIPYAAVYPYNHVFEIDDTLNNERLFTSHRTGTSQEIDKDGNQVNIIKGDHYNIISGKRQVVIDGQTDITIGGRHKLYINKDGATGNHYDIQIGQNANVNIQIDKGDLNIVLKDGKLNTNVAGDYNMKIGGNMNLDVRGNKVETVSGSKTSNTTGNVIHRGARIDLNP